MATSEAPQQNGSASLYGAARHVTKREAVAAARAKVAMNKHRGRDTEPWIEHLANEGRKVS